MKTVGETDDRTACVASVPCTQERPFKQSTQERPFKQSMVARKLSESVVVERARGSLARVF